MTGEGSHFDFFEWQQQLHRFSNEIENCIANGEWDGLANILKVRQICLEQLFAVSIPEDQKLFVKTIALSILEQDATYVARIEEHKKFLSSQQLALDHNRKAIQVYTNC